MNNIREQAENTKSTTVEEKLTDLEKSLWGVHSSLYGPSVESADKDVERRSLADRLLEKVGECQRLVNTIKDSVGSIG